MPTYHTVTALSQMRIVFRIYSRVKERIVTDSPLSPCTERLVPQRAFLFLSSCDTLQVLSASLRAGKRRYVPSFFDTIAVGELLFRSLCNRVFAIVNCVHRSFGMDNSTDL